MAEFILDLSQYRDRVGARVAEGRYRVRVDDAELNKSKAGNPMVELWLTIQGGEFDGMTLTDRLTLTVAPAAKWIAEYYPTTSVEDMGDRVAVTFPIASRDWAVSLILRLGGAVLEVSDEQVAEAARARAKAALAGYPASVG